MKGQNGGTVASNGLIWLAAALVILPIVAESRPVEMANFRKLFRQPGDLSNVIATDNLQECVPSVRKAIKRSRPNWGIFHFVCVNGLVRNVFVDPQSPINAKPEVFIRKNLGLFDLRGSAVTVNFDGDKGIELFKGSVVNGAEIFRQVRKGDIPTPESAHPRPISTRDLESQAGVLHGEHVVFELGIVDPEDHPLVPSPGVKDALEPAN